MSKGFTILYTVILVVVICIFAYFYVALYSENKQLKETLQYDIEKVKIEKDSIIRSKQLRIDSLTFVNVPLYNEIELLKYRYDSLLLKKQKIKIIYRDKLKQIDSMQTIQILEYWKDEFN